MQISRVCIYICGTREIPFLPNDKNLIWWLRGICRKICKWREQQRFNALVAGSLARVTERRSYRMKKKKNVQRNRKARFCNFDAHVCASLWGRCLTLCALRKVILYCPLKMDRVKTCRFDIHTEKHFFSKFLKKLTI